MLSLGSSLVPRIDSGATARLWCPEVEDEEWEQLRRPRIRPRLLRGAPALALRRLRDHNALAVKPVVNLRRRALVDRAPGAPRVLLRVDEFPDARARDDPRRRGTAAYAGFHETLADAEIPYLVAVLPRVARDYLAPGGDDGEPLDHGEQDMLHQLQGTPGVSLGLHAHTHRTRDERPAHRSAISGLEAPDLEAALNRAESTLLDLGLPRPRVFVPPFNRFDGAQYPVLARRYDVICGGPESVRAMGLQPSPIWLGEAVYLPGYAPVYERARAVRPAIEALERAQAAVWVAVTLHPGWEYDDGLSGLRGLVPALKRLARPWDEFISAAARSRGGDGLSAEVGT